MASYSRYSHHARRAMTHASLLVQRHRHPRVDTGHLLVGVMLTRGSIGYNILNALTLSADRAEPKLASLTLPLDKAPEAPTNDAALDIALELASDESSWLGHHYVGTEHLLLGITRTNIGNAADLLHALGVQPDQLRRRVRATLSENQETEFSLDVLRRNANLSELSRRVLNAAEQVSVEHDHPIIGLGHLLLVMLREKRSMMSSLLVDTGLQDSTLTAGIKHGDSLLLTSIEVVITPAVEISRRMGSHYTGTEHLLLALTEHTTGTDLLTRLNVSPNALRQRIQDRLAGTG